MANRPAPTSETPLTSEQRDVVAAARLGCDRATAQRCVGWSSRELVRQLAAHAGFRRELERAEAALELSHLRNVQAAAADEKNWRASVWWLERRAPERYGRRACAAAVGEWAPLVCEALAAALPDAEACARAQTAVREIAERIAVVRPVGRGGRQAAVEAFASPPPVSENQAGGPRGARGRQACRNPSGGGRATTRRAQPSDDRP